MERVVHRRARPRGQGLDVTVAAWAVARKNALHLGGAAGVIAPGRWIDRRGQSVVLAAAGPACAASLVALAAVT